MSLLFVVKKQTFSPYFSSNFWLGILLCQLGKRRCFAFGSGAEFRPPKWPEKEHWCRNGLDWLVFYVPVNNFSVMLRRSHFFLGIISTLGRWKCLSQGHYTAVVGFELWASRSRVRRSTTEPPRLHMPKYTSLFTTIIGDFPIVVYNMADLTQHNTHIHMTYTQKFGTLRSSPFSLYWKPNRSKNSDAWPWTWHTLNIETFARGRSSFRKHT